MTHCTSAFSDALRAAYIRQTVYEDVQAILFRKNNSGRVRRSPDTRSRMKRCTRSQSAFSMFMVSRPATGKGIDRRRFH